MPLIVDGTPALLQQSRAPALFIFTASFILHQHSPYTNSATIQSIPLADPIRRIVGSSEAGKSQDLIAWRYLFHVVPVSVDQEHFPDKDRYGLLIVNKEQSVSQAFDLTASTCAVA